MLLSGRKKWTEDLQAFTSGLGTSKIDSIIKFSQGITDIWPGTAHEKEASTSHRAGPNTDKADGGQNLEAITAYPEITHYRQG